MQLLRYLAIIITILLAAACEKDRSFEGSGPVGPTNPSTGIKKKVVADAGHDITITLPVDSLILNGSKSYDSSGAPLNYSWQAIGSPLATISNPSAAITPVKLTVPAKYRFVLQVWNSNGSARDTVEVTLKDNCAPSSTITPQLVEVSIVPDVFDWEPLPIYALGNKIIIAKAWEDTSSAHGNTLSIYDVNAQTWTTRYLPTGRSNAAVVVAGHKLFFAGGATNPFSSSFAVTDAVEVYDVITDSWSAMSLSEPRMDIKAAVAGNKIIFGGGWKNGNVPSKTVDIYDLVTGQWTTSSLPGPAREVGAAVAIQNQVYFSGGVTSLQLKTLYNSTGQLAGSYLLPSAASKSIDIFNVSTSTWSVDSMATPRIDFTAITANSNLYFAGGIDLTSGYPDTLSADSFLGNVEIKKFNPHSFRNSCLSRNVRLATSAKKGDNVIFFSGWDDNSGKFDIYNSVTDAWTVALVPNVNLAQSAIVSCNNELYVVANAGGITKLFKLVF